MTDTTTTNEAPVDTTTAETPDTTEATDTTPQDAPDAPQTADEAEVDREADEAQHGREAAKYRRKLREVETERDGLRAQLEAMRRAVIDDFLVAERRPAKGELLFAAGVQMGDLLNEDGTVSREKVFAQLDAAGRKLGVPVRLPAAPSADGQGRVGKSIYDGSTHGWADAFAPRR